MGVAGAMTLPGANGPPGVGGAPAAADAGVAPAVDCVLGEFQAPEPLSGLEQGLNPDQVLKLWSPSLSADGHTLVFAINGDSVNEQIETAVRADRGTVFSPAAAVDGVNSVGANGTPSLSADGLSLYFFSTRPGGLGDRDIWFATRPDVGAAFADPTLVAGVNGPSLDHLPWASLDGLTLLWATPRWRRGPARHLDRAPKCPQRWLFERGTIERRQHHGQRR